MAGPYSSYIPKDVNEIRDYLGMMMLSSPTFIDNTGYFYDRNIETVFNALNEGLRIIHGKSEESRYLILRKMSDQMRAHFEADPEDKTAECLKGREIIEEMRSLLKHSIHKSQPTSLP